MKFLIERQEIAKALNFGKYPVINLDIEDESKQFTIDDEVLGFSNIEVRIPTRDYTIQAQMKWYNDSKTITFGSSCTCISSSFGYQDVMEDVRYANAPIIDRNEEFILVLHSSKTKNAMVLMLKTADCKDVNCSSTLRVDEQIDLLNLARLLRSDY